MADENVPTEPPRVRNPICICNAEMMPVTENRSKTDTFGSDWPMITVKRNFICPECHAHCTIQHDNGDDPKGYTR